MSEYMGGPYNNRSTYEITVTGVNIGDQTAVKIAVTRTEDTVTVSFLNTSDAVIASFDIPEYDGSAGALTQNLYTLFSNAAALISSHASDDSIHLSEAERAKLDEIASQFGLDSIIQIDIDPTYVEPTSGLNLRNLLANLAGNEIALKNLIQDNDLSKLTQVVATKADKSDTYTKDQVDDLLDDKADQDTTYTKTEVDALIKTAGAVIGTADTGISGVTWRTESHTETVDSAEKTWVRATALFKVSTLVNTLISNSMYNWCAPNVLGDVSMPCTFESMPRIVMGVQHDSIPSNTQGTGVWAVLTHAKQTSDGTADYSKLPTVRLQCASPVTTAMNYYISVEVEGYKA